MPHHFFHENAPKTRLNGRNVEGELEVGKIKAKMRQSVTDGGFKVEEGRGTVSVPARLRG